MLSLPLPSLFAQAVLKSWKVDPFNNLIFSTFLHPSKFRLPLSLGYVIMTASKGFAHPTLSRSPLPSTGLGQVVYNQHITGELRVKFLMPTSRMRQTKLGKLNNLPKSKCYILKANLASVLSLNLCGACSQG